jgi:nucleotide-binding universal stress UspA family protein
MAIKNIAVSVAGSAASLVTAKYALCLAKLLQAKLTAIYVVDEKALHELLHSRIFVEVEAREYERDLRDQGELFLERLKKAAQSKGVEFEGLLLSGTIYETVIHVTRERGADLLVIGELKECLSRTETFYDEAERIFHESACPVVVVKNQVMVETLYKEL